MFKIVEKFNKDLGKIIYTVLDQNNERVCEFVSKRDAERFINQWLAANTSNYLN